MECSLNTSLGCHFKIKSFPNLSFVIFFLDTFSPLSSYAASLCWPLDVHKVTMLHRHISVYKYKCPANLLPPDMQVASSLLLSRTKPVCEIFEPKTKSLTGSSVGCSMTNSEYDLQTGKLSDISGKLC